eukprot:CAMPEP_0114232150 /NCGR_PEP_ID=MMETSP0058-20121206/4444_1 /TAXON_ID=36894 /ORGANISM="Pyramimonas parkeae, CCMP726" /LENGTH=202 /DNA_ID=CAMNT_0001343587 /DNA_START=2135 /DNA_END=2743 /DNA_ORIENTATION=+
MTRQSIGQILIALTTRHKGVQLENCTWIRRMAVKCRPVVDAKSEYGGCGAMQLPSRTQAIHRVFLLVASMLFYVLGMSSQSLNKGESHKPEQLDVMRSYDKYAQEWNEMWKSLFEAFCQRQLNSTTGTPLMWPLCSSFGTLESELIYMKIRESQPVDVLEIAPQHGYSSIIMLIALEKNGKGTLYSFDFRLPSLVGKATPTS